MKLRKTAALLSSAMSLTVKKMLTRSTYAANESESG